MSARPWQAAADRLLDGLHAVFGDRLRSVAAYGPHLDGTSDGLLACLTLVANLTVADLEACADLSHDWTRDHIATPLLLTEYEFERSLDAFPLEYAEIQRGYMVLFGTDPFARVAIDQADLRRACEAQVKSHLLHLREGFIEAGGSPRAIGDLVIAAAPAFAALLRNVARLEGLDIRDHAEASLEGARLAGLPTQTIADILAVGRPAGVPMADAARLFTPYLAVVERLTQFVDGWRHGRPHTGHERT
jgi:hypothetical protein